MSYLRKIGRELTKKAGPLPRWVWGVVAVGGLIVYRRRQALGQATGFGQQSANNSAYGQPSNPDLAYVPGGSIPISPDVPSPSGGDTGGLIDLLSQIIGNKETPPPAPTTPGANVQHAAAAPRKPKPKAQHKPKPKKRVIRKRSHAHVKPKTHTPKPKQQGGKSILHFPYPRKPPTNKHSKVRARPKTKLRYGPIQTQRPVASHAKAVAAHASPPRPSSPPRRTQRTRGK